MANFRKQLVIGIPLRSKLQLYDLNDDSPREDSSPYENFYRTSKDNDQKAAAAMVAAGWMSKLSRRAESLAKGIKQHVKLGNKLTETVKGKVSLGARIIHAGGVSRVFRQSFQVSAGERLLKASQCHLSTTAGPVAGMLFVSTEKVAFLSDRSLTLTSSKGAVSTRIPYKVLIPLGRIKKVRRRENTEKPQEKYMRLVTVDGFEFWFMGFVDFRTAFKRLKQAVADHQSR